ncbi:hypothetical protein DCAR_0205828 [Daucus carota subsp. sativus]|uniref:Uncharacterized protein n=1 Tax=Daucus carota subsp. sativus TaxID=79200 RepID=A0A166CUI9_DAUCS|nr:hypothetical protein DCAR_0205828 [Daucus carota subsp. sativus]
MERLPNLSNLKQLERLDLRYCYALTDIQGLEELTSLRLLKLGVMLGSASGTWCQPVLEAFKIRTCGSNTASVSISYHKNMPDYLAWQPLVGCTGKLEETAKFVACLNMLGGQL